MGDIIDQFLDLTGGAGAQFDGVDGFEFSDLHQFSAELAVGASGPYPHANTSSYSTTPENYGGYDAAPQQPAWHEFPFFDAQPQDQQAHSNGLSDGSYDSSDTFEIPNMTPENSADHHEQQKVSEQHSNFRVSKSTPSAAFQDFTPDFLYQITYDNLNKSGHIDNEADFTFLRESMPFPQVAEFQIPPQESWNMRPTGQAAPQLQAAPDGMSRPMQFAEKSEAFSAASYSASRNARPRQQRPVQTTTQPPYSMSPSPMAHPNQQQFPQQTTWTPPQLQAVQMPISQESASPLAQPDFLASQAGTRFDPSVQFDRSTQFDPSTQYEPSTQLDPSPQGGSYMRFDSSMQFDPSLQSPTEQLSASTVASNGRPSMPHPKVLSNHDTSLSPQQQSVSSQGKRKMAQTEDQQPRKRTKMGLLEQSRVFKSPKKAMDYFQDAAKSTDPAEPTYNKHQFASLDDAKQHLQRKAAEIKYFKLDLARDDVTLPSASDLESIKQDLFSALACRPIDLTEAQTTFSGKALNALNKKHVTHFGGLEAKFSYDEKCKDISAHIDVLVDVVKSIHEKGIPQADLNLKKFSDYEIENELLNPEQVLTKSGRKVEYDLTFLNRLATIQEILKTNKWVAHDVSEGKSFLELACAPGACHRLKITNCVSNWRKGKNTKLGRNVRKQQGGFDTEDDEDDDEDE